VSGVGNKGNDSQHNPSDDLVFKGVRIGRRIQVVGNSCSGKSYLGRRLSERLNIPFVELDALNWKPNWIGLNETDPEELIDRMKKATSGLEWVVAGNYTIFSQSAFWPRLETIIWLDLPLFRLIRRLLTRSWRRWRSRELLWGTNYETFWPQLMVWRGKDSLLWWIVTQHRRKRRDLKLYNADPRWHHIRFIRFTSSTEISNFLASMNVQS
jgi:adenylate kinase family enzyme